MFYCKVLAHRVVAFYLNYDGVNVCGVLFLFNSPANEKNKEAQTFIDGIKVGDKVITIAGIHGKIASINDEDKTF